MSGVAPSASSSSVNWIASTALAGGSGTRLTFGGEHDPERPLRPHHQLGEVERPIGARELVEVVAHDAAQHLRVAALDLVGVRARQLAHGAIAARFEAVARAGAVESLRRQRSEVHHRSVGEDDVLFEDVVDGLAVIHRAGAARVVGHHAPDRRPAGGRDVGGEAQSVRPKPGIELVEHDPRLDERPALVDVHVEHGVEMLRGVDDEARADGLAALRRAAAAQRERAAEARADPDDGHQVLPGAGQHHAERFQGVDAGVGRVERARDRVEADFGGGLGPQRALQRRGVHPGGVGVGKRLDRVHLEQGHRLDSPARSRSSPRARLSPPLANETRSVPSPPGP